MSRKGTGGYGSLGTLVATLLFAGGISTVAFSQAGSSVSASATSPSTSQTPTVLDVNGRVVNALTGAPIPRALVNLNSRAVLTDALGRFTFPAFTLQGSPTTASTRAFAQVSKPGYAAALDATEAASPQQVDLSGSLELKLYPDALITGTVTGSDGLPLPKVQLTAFRESGDEAARRLVPVGFTSTDSHGAFRFDEPPGHYSLMLRYNPRLNGAPEAVLPQRYPEQTASNRSNSFIVAPGEERKVDLQAHTGTAYPVSFQVEGDEERGMNIRMVVRSSTSGSFTISAQPTRTPGEFHIDLPSGSYQLHGIQQTRERRLEADSRVTVAGHAVAGLAMHFADVPSLPVEVVVDNSVSLAGGTAATTLQIQPPTPLNLNLHLQKLGEPEDDALADVRVTTLPDKSYAFQAGSGVYRLMSQSGGGWFVEKASYGTSDLLTQRLTIAAGAGADSIRVTVSNARGQVAGTVRLNGAGAPGFVYLLPHDPSLVPVYTARVGADGTYSQTLPPGTYTVVAFDHRFSGDLSDPAVLAHLSGGTASAQVTSGAKASLDLTLQPVEKVQ